MVLIRKVTKPGYSVTHGIDSTFNINKLYLSLLISIDVINSNKIFSYILNYYLDKIVKFYNFFFQILREKI